jgi:hypothetical protein
MRSIERGEKCNRLTFICDLAERGRENRRMSLWECDCGAEVKAATGRVVGGYIDSCGCAGRERTLLKVTTHGMKYTKEYGTWNGIKGRCLTVSNKDFYRYGGKGITIADEWINDFQAFFDHIGPAPSPSHQVDRIDNTKGYLPGNVRWATTKEQCMNRRNSKRWTVKGVVFESITDAAAHFDVSTQTISRWCYGFPDKRRGTYTEKREDCHADLKY